MDSIAGVVKSINYSKDDYWIIVMTPEESDPEVPHTKVSVVGSLYGLTQVVVSTRICFEGEWSEHPKFGRQFKISGWRPYARTSADVRDFLFNCVNMSYFSAELIAKTWGLKAFQELRESKEKVQNFVQDEHREEWLGSLLLWAKAANFVAFSQLFGGRSIPSAAIHHIILRFGSDAYERVKANPYLLLEVNGFTLKQMDALASKFGLSLASDNRFVGFVLWCLRQELLNGHLYIRLSELSGLLQNLARSEGVVFFSPPDLQDKLERAKGLLQDQAVLHKHGVYLKTSWRSESHSAKHLSKFLHYKNKRPVSVDVSEFIRDYQSGNKIDFSETQKEALHKLLSQRVLVLTGLPGTGKTSMVRAFVRLFHQAGITFSLMAPTGIAAKRLASVTNETAATIHRSLRFNGETWGCNADNTLSVGAVIIDEMSMVDQELFLKVLEALHPETMLVLVGDDAQLPSVGAGNVLRELLACPVVPHVRLTSIFRQAQTSEIVLNAHSINKGLMLDLNNNKPKGEFQFIQTKDEESSVGLIVRMVANLKEKKSNFQVMTPKYAGAVGVDNLNQVLRDTINPDVGQPQWGFVANNFRLGDRVMVIKNDYDLNVYNGDMGKIVDITKQEICVKIHGLGSDGVDMLVNIPKKTFISKVRLAYAISVHKSQGCEFDVVILPIVKSQGRMLQRNLFYTAVTRAKKQIWVVGSRQAVEIAIKNNEVVRRNTMFADSLAEEFARQTETGV
jgi:exodeoxyribonuclease V alpha subunit